MSPDQRGPGRSFAGSLVHRALVRGLRKGVEVAPMGRTPEGPVLISGFLTDDRGVGEAARLTIKALRHAGIAVLEHDIGALLRGRVPISPPSRGFGTWIIHCNPDEARQVLKLFPATRDHAARRIGFWVWELPRAPQSWIETIPLFNEIWTPSRFSAAALAGTGIPVRVMAHPVSIRSSGPRPASGPVVFTSAADARSSLSRKNPIGALRTYLMAFPSETGATRFVLKLSAVDGSTFAEIMTLTKSRQDIEIQNCLMSADDIGTLLERTDVFVSLHRAEGFGLMIAEAMALGKSVIATAWSGNLDFMPNIPVQRIGFSLDPVDDPQGLYSGQAWANPDLDQAARAMRELAGDAALRDECGRANQAAVAENLAAWSPEALGLLRLG